MDIKDFDNKINVDEAAENFAQNRDPEEVKAFFQNVQNTEFIVPYRGEVNKIPLFGIEGKGQFIPAFSSYAAFEKSPLPKDQAAVVLFSKIDEILQKSAGKIAGIIINPHGKSMLFQRSSQQQNQTAPTEKAVKFMKPGMIPETVAAVLHGYFTACEKVYAAYILLAQKESDLAPHLFLIVDFDGKAEEFFPKLAEALRPCLKKGDNIEMAKANFKLLQAAEKLVKPFYKKS